MTIVRSAPDLRLLLWAETPTFSLQCHPIHFLESWLRPSLNEEESLRGSLSAWFVLLLLSWACYQEGVIRKSASPHLSHFISPDYRLRLTERGRGPEKHPGSLLKHWITWCHQQITRQHVYFFNFKNSVKHWTETVNDLKLWREKLMNTQSIYWSDTTFCLQLNVC